MKKLQLILKSRVTGVFLLVITFTAGIVGCSKDSSVITPTPPVCTTCTPPAPVSAQFTSGVSVTPGPNLWFNFSGIASFSATNAAKAELLLISGTDSIVKSTTVKGSTDNLSLQIPAMTQPGNWSVRLTGSDGKSVYSSFNTDVYCSFITAISKEGKSWKNTSLTRTVGTTVTTLIVDSSIIVWTPQAIANGMNTGPVKNTDTQGNVTTGSFVVQVLPNGDTNLWDPLLVTQKWVIKPTGFSPTSFTMVLETTGSGTITAVYTAQ